MQVELEIPGADACGRVFLTWVPVRATARVTNAVGSGPVKVTLRNAGTGGQVQLATTRTHRGTATLDVRLPANGKPVVFFVAGSFGQPSVELDDAAVQARPTGKTAVLGVRRLTVRVRKDATRLTDRERDRFLSAFGILNNRGAGRFREFRDMHVRSTLAESHGNMGFLPWHRAYLLDLERELQAIDPTVALPYWRFGEPAPSLFDMKFMGASDANGRVSFAPGHPLEGWVAAGVPGITRLPAVPAPALRTESDTLQLGGIRPNATYGAFVEMEDNPHGWAHGASFAAGVITDPATSPQDPLFFLLHCNVDRLWAKWQWYHKRTDPAEPRAFADGGRVGHRLADRMWPWNGATARPRPSTAPGGALASSPTTAAPGGSPTVRSMLDYQAVAGGADLGFAYDDVPFEN
jgi:tyrosinase